MPTPNVSQSYMYQVLTLTALRAVGVANAGDGLFREVAGRTEVGKTHGLRLSAGASRVQCTFEHQYGMNTVSAMPRTFISSMSMMVSQMPAYLEFMFMLAVGSRDYTALRDPKSEPSGALGLGKSTPLSS